jgi:hypothetical protein
VKERILDEDNGAKNDAGNEGRGAKGAANKRPAQMDEQAAQKLSEVCFCVFVCVFVYVYACVCTVRMSCTHGLTGCAEAFGCVYVCMCVVCIQCISTSRSCVSDFWGY